MKPRKLSAADQLFNEVAAQLRKQKGYRPLTPAEAQAAYDSAEPVPLSEERIEEIVAYVLREAEKGTQ